MIKNLTLTTNINNTENMASLIRERRSIRRFETHPISTQQITELLQLSIQSPALEQQEAACRFILVSSPEGKESLAAGIIASFSEHGLYRRMPNKLKQMFIKRTAQIPAFLVAIQKGSAKESIKNYAAICAILQSFSLLAWDHQLGTVWNTEPYIYNKLFTDKLDLNEQEQVVCIMYVGKWKKMPNSKHRTAIKEKLTFK